MTTTLRVRKLPKSHWVTHGVAHDVEYTIEVIKRRGVCLVRVPRWPAGQPPIEIEVPIRTGQSNRKALFMAHEIARERCLVVRSIVDRVSKSHKTKPYAPPVEPEIRPTLVERLVSAARIMGLPVVWAVIVATAPVFWLFRRRFMFELS